MAYPFRNLVFQGGGVKTFAYRGVLEVLESRGILNHIERVAGTSAGAMIAALLSFRVPVAEMFDVMNTLDFSRIPSTAAPRDLSTILPEFISPYVERLTDSASTINRLMSRYGWYSTDYALNWILETIATYCDGNGMATFADFRQRGFRDLYIVATNISRQKTEIFSARHTPDAPVAHALVMSQSIPLFFEAFQFGGAEAGKSDYYADGGVLNNYPLHLFDSLEYESSSAWFIAGMNWETLGCRLYTPDDRRPELRPVNNLIQYVANLLEAVLEAQDVAYDNNIVDHNRTINISNCGVLATDFDVRPGNPRYTELLEAGRMAGLAFLDSYNPPNRHFWDWLKRNWMHLRR